MEPIITDHDNAVPAPDTPEDYGPLTVVYRDEHFVAVDKPRGLLTHRTPIEPKETAAVQLVRDLIGHKVYPIHRLDRPTSGLLMFGLSKHAARKLGKLFMANEVRKTYLAITRGFAPERGLIDRALTVEGKAEPREAVTEYERLATIQLDLPVGVYPTARFSLTAVYPRTGRRHQIRRHLAHINHPIIGDTRHGDGAQNRFFREHFDVRRLCLFAMRLRFRHPFDDVDMDLCADLPPEYQTLFARFGWNEAMTAFAERD